MKKSIMANINASKLRESNGENENNETEGICEAQRNESIGMAAWHQLARKSWRQPVKEMRNSAGENGEESSLSKKAFRRRRKICQQIIRRRKRPSSKGGILRKRNSMKMSAAKAEMC